MSQSQIVQLRKQRNQRTDELPRIGQAHIRFLAGEDFLQWLHAQILCNPVQGIVFRKKHQRFQKCLVTDLHQALPAIVQIACHGTEQRFALGRDQHNAQSVLCPL